MPRRFQLAALLLLALWLPATLHCQIENAGLTDWFGCAQENAATSGTNADDCHDDPCFTVESGQFAYSKTEFHFAAPVATLNDCLACLLCLAPEASPAPVIFPVRQHETLPLQRTWQFVRRAAPPARAPDRLNA